MRKYVFLLLGLTFSIALSAQQDKSFIEFVGKFKEMPASYTLDLAQLKKDFIDSTLVEISLKIMLLTLKVA